MLEIYKSLSAYDPPYPFCQNMSYPQKQKSTCTESLGIIFETRADIQIDTHTDSSKYFIPLLGNGKAIKYT